MRLTEISRTCGGQTLTIRFTSSEFIVILAMFQTLVRSWEVGQTREKQVKCDLEKIMDFYEDTIKNKIEYKYNDTSINKPKVFYSGR